MKNRSQLLALRTDPRVYFFSCSKSVLQITNGFASVCLLNFVIESACAPSTNDLLKIFPASE